MNQETRTGRNHFLGIGISEYQYLLHPLPNAVKDVEDVAKVLQERYGFDEKDTQILKDTEATRAKIVDTLAKYSKLEQEDSLIIYFAGHGNPENWIGYDTKTDEPSTYVESTTIINRIKKVKCLHILLICDSCFSAGMIQENNRDALLPNESVIENEEESFYESLAKKKSRLLLTSGRSDQKVSDGQEKNSPFTKNLLAELKNNNRSYLIISEIFPMIQKKTKELTKTQIPYSCTISNAGDEEGALVFRLKTNQEQLNNKNSQSIINNINSHNLKHQKIIAKNLNLENFQNLVKQLFEA